MDSPVTCLACGELNLVAASTPAPFCRRCRNSLATPGSTAAQHGKPRGSGYGRMLAEPAESAPDVLADPAGGESEQLRDAGRLARLGGFVIDLLFAILIFAMVFLLSGTELTQESSADDEPIDLTMPFLIAMILSEGLQAILMAKRGQSIGKMLFRTQVVDDQGRIPSFYRGVIARRWAQILFQAILPIYELIDALFIFGPRRRCLHDRMADTRVISRG